MSKADQWGNTFREEMYIKTQEYGRVPKVLGTEQTS
jgi:hypothetical protein